MLDMNQKNDFNILYQSNQFIPDIHLNHIRSEYGTNLDIPVDHHIVIPQTPSESLNNACKYIAEQQTKGFVGEFSEKDKPENQFKQSLIRTQLNQTRKLERNQTNCQQINSNNNNDEEYINFWLSLNIVKRISVEFQTLKMPTKDDNDDLVQEYYWKASNIIRDLKTQNLIEASNSSLNKKSKSELNEAMLVFVTQINELRKSLLSFRLEHKFIDYNDLNKDQKEEFKQFLPEIVKKEDDFSQYFENPGKNSDKKPNILDDMEYIVDSPLPSLYKFDPNNKLKSKKEIQSSLASTATKINTVLNNQTFTPTFSNTFIQTNTNTPLSNFNKTTNCQSLGSFHKQLSPVIITNPKSGHRRKLVPRPRSQSLQSNSQKFNLKTASSLFWSDSDPLSSTRTVSSMSSSDDDSLSFSSNSPLTPSFASPLEQLERLSTPISVNIDPSILTVEDPFPLISIQQGGNSQDYIYRFQNSDEQKFNGFNSKNNFINNTDNQKSNQNEMHKMMAIPAYGFRIIDSQVLLDKGLDDVVNFAGTSANLELNKIWCNLGFTSHQRLKMVLKYSDTSTDLNARLTEMVGFWKMVEYSVVRFDKALHDLKYCIKYDTGMEKKNGIQKCIKEFNTADTAVLKAAASLKEETCEDLIVWQQPFQDYYNKKRRKFDKLMSTLNDNGEIMIPETEEEEKEPEKPESEFEGNTNYTQNLLFDIDAINNIENLL
ncbi:hypothetical protein TRFO_22054 [Tritrichomonas foetus]|uniref:Uncharacterized protein n=1 Tax=Tritrichomonas foetus TaxID=1144522 RepID=A0A1J4KCR6_9EUKA|nr:hypothetical protein TRFO_22054 [Tritrichomonas foetus]|eukprot:OHT09209.1 hypothetical protein TRFO_22054 [Tritrichomonas foetus]